MKKTLAFIIGLCLAAVSCEIVDTRLSLGKSKSEAFDKSDSTSNREHGGLPSTPTQTKKDTILYFSAVEVPKSYDWRRDTACGSATAQIILYRNYEPVLTFSAGAAFHVSTDPDSHHLIGGNLYTEYSDLSRTYVKCNGTDLFNYEGRERLRGLCVKDSVVWTLGQNLSGEGFSLRRNGEKAFSSASGEVFGDLLLQPQGALYWDNEKLCFCYKVSGSGGTSLFSVTDCSSTQISGSHTLVQDMLVSGGNVSILASGKNGEKPYICTGLTRTSISATESLFEGYLCNLFNTVAAAGFIGSSPDKSSCCIFHHGNLTRGYSCECCYLYRVSTAYASVSIDQGTVRIRKVDGREVYPEGRHHFFSRSCAAFLDNRYWIALTPQTEGSLPLILSDGKERSVDVNGFLSAVEIIVQ